MARTREAILTIIHHPLVCSLLGFSQLRLHVAQQRSDKKDNSVLKTLKQV